MAKFEEILRDAKNKVFYPFYFLNGEETFFIDEITNYLEQNILDETAKSFNQTILYGRDVTARQVFDLARGFPMMGNYQVIILKEAQSMRDLEGLELYLDNIQPTTILIVNYKHKKADGRTGFIKKITKLEKQGKAVYFEAKKLYDNKIPVWISDTVKLMGYRINQMACMLLSEYIGNDLNKLANEIGKLIINLNQGEEITENDVEKYIGISKDFNVFELQRAFSAKNALKAFRIADYFEANPKENQLYVILPVLNNFFLKVFQIHFLKGKSRNEIAAAIGVNPFFLNDYITAAKVFAPQKIIKIVAEIKDVDLKWKGYGVTDATSYGPFKELIHNILN